MAGVGPDAFRSPRHGRRGWRTAARALCAAVLGAGVAAGAWLAPAPALAAGGGEAALRAPTLQTRIGMWYEPDAPMRSKLWQPGDPGEPLFLRGRVIDVHGRPVERALIEMWHADSEGFVELGQFRARLHTDEAGRFGITTVLPGYIFGPRHIHFQITHPDQGRLVTRVFFKRDPVIALHDYEAVILVLEDGTTGDQRALFGSVEFVMPPS